MSGHQSLTVELGMRLHDMISKNGLETLTDQVATSRLDWQVVHEFVMVTGVMCRTHSFVKTKQRLVIVIYGGSMV